MQSVATDLNEFAGTLAALVPAIAVKHPGAPKSPWMTIAMPNWAFRLASNRWQILMYMELSRAMIHYPLASFRQIMTFGDIEHPISTHGDWSAENLIGLAGIKNPEKWALRHRHIHVTLTRYRKELLGDAWMYDETQPGMMALAPPVAARDNKKSRHIRPIVHGILLRLMLTGADAKSLTQSEELIGYLNEDFAKLERKQSKPRGPARKKVPMPGLD